MAGACCKPMVCHLRCGEAWDSGDTVDVRESVKLVILGQRVFFLGDIWILPYNFLTLC